MCASISKPGQSIAPSTATRTRRLVVLLGTLLGFLLAGLPATAATFTVGSDPDNCDFVSLSAALAAAAANDTPIPSNDLIKLANDQLYWGQYDIKDQGVTIRGGYADCLPGTPVTGTTKILRHDGSRHFKISSSVGRMYSRLEHLRLTYDGAPTLWVGRGGSIFQTGDTTLTLQDTTVENGAANFGGGIHLENSAGAYPRLLLEGLTVLRDNQAETGGGISCEPHTDVSLNDLSLLLNNRSKNGGGIYADGCTVNIRSKSPWTGIIQNSATEDGGGLYAKGQTVVYSWPTTISINKAKRGGGVFASAEGTRLFFLDGLISDNTAEVDGGGIYAEDLAEVDVYYSTYNSDCLDDLKSCAAVSYNVAGEHGGAFYAGSGAKINADRTRLADNMALLGGSVATGIGPETLIRMHHSVVVGNTGDVMVELEEEAQFEGRFLTLGDNHPLSEPPWTMVTYAADSFLTNSIYWDDDGRVHDGPAFGSPRWNCFLLKASTDNPGSVFFRVGGADFVDESARDFRLKDTSKAIDMCDSDGTSTIQDRLGNPLAVNLPNPDGLGTYDAGAFERQEAEEGSTPEE